MTRNSRFGNECAPVSCWERLKTIPKPAHTRVVGARSAAEDLGSGLNAVADDPAIAVTAAWGQGVDRAFKAVEGVRDALRDNFEGFIVFVTADFTFHTSKIGSAGKGGCVPWKGGNKGVASG